jgi:AraC-like DNA-binding protein
MTDRFEIDFDANSLPASRRLRRWQELIGDHLADVDMRAPPRTSMSEAYRGGMAVRAAPAVTFAGVSSANHRLNRTRERIRRADREMALVNIILSGQCHFEQEGRRSILEPGDLCIYESVRPYEIVAEGAFKVQVVMVERARMEAALGNLRSLTGARINGGGAAAALTREFWLRLAGTCNAVSDAELTALCATGLDLLRIAAGSPGSFSKDGTASGLGALRRARAFMSENLARASMSLADIAHATGLSQRRLQELFQGAGTTVTSDLRKMRLDTARGRLSDPYFSCASMQMIMESVGFRDQSHFSRMFKKAYGKSPRDWRNATKKDPDR